MDDTFVCKCGNRKLPAWSKCFDCSKYVKHPRVKLTDEQKSSARKEYYRKWYKANKSKKEIYNAEYRKSHLRQIRERYQKNKFIFAEKRKEAKIASGWKPKTDWLYTKKICRVCKKESKNLIKLNKYHICRECNTERCRKYRHTKRGGERFRVSVYKSIQKYPEKTKARHKVYEALSTGKIVKLPCEVCGDIKSTAHHEDYSKPLEVKWLCRGHHADADKKQRLIHSLH